MLLTDPPEASARVRVAMVPGVGREVEAATAKDGLAGMPHSLAGVTDLNFAPNCLIPDETDHAARTAAPG